MTRADAQVIELAAELPPRQAAIGLLVLATPDGLSVRWEAGGRHGMMAGSPGEVTRALGALVLRLAGVGEGLVAVADEEPTRRIARIAP